MPNIEEVTAMLEAADKGASSDNPEDRDVTEADASAASETEQPTGSAGAGASGEQTRLEEAAADDGSVQGSTPGADEAEERKKAELEELRAKIEKVRATTAEKREQKRLKAERESLEAEKQKLAKYYAQIEAQRKQYESFDEEFRKDPVAALEKRGVPAPLAYEKITNRVLQKQTPEEIEEAKKEAWFKEWEAKYGPKLSKLEELEQRQAEWERRELERQQQSIQHRQSSNEREFLEIAKGNGHEILADYYEDSELLLLGNALADELASNGEPFTVEDVVKELSSRLQAQIQRAEQRRTQRTATSQSKAPPAPASTKAPPGATENKPGTITNDMASATATAARKAKTPAERRAEAERELAANELRT